MKVYLIVEVDSQGRQFVRRKCFSNKEKAEDYCYKKNKDTYDYLLSCDDNYVSPDNYTLLEVREIEVIENE